MLLREDLVLKDKLRTIGYVVLYTKVSVETIDHRSA